jgi:hypothetical protein
MSDITPPDFDTLLAAFDRHDYKIFLHVLKDGKIPLEAVYVVRIHEGLLKLPRERRTCLFKCRYLAVKDLVQFHRTVALILSLLEIAEVLSNSTGIPIRKQSCCT